jgi:hypothetical protein
MVQESGKLKIVSRDLDVIHLLLDLAVDYNCSGYEKFESDWNNYNYCSGNVDNIRRGNVNFYIGEEKTFSAPRLEVEEIVCRFVKAVGIIETWESEDTFVDEWERIFEGVPEDSIQRYYYLGWENDKYYGWKMEGNVVRQSRKFVSFKRRVFKRYWDSAWKLIEATRLMENMVIWAGNALMSEDVGRFVRDCPFDFGFDM